MPTMDGVPRGKGDRPPVRGNGLRRAVALAEFARVIRRAPLTLAKYHDETVRLAERRAFVADEIPRIVGSSQQVAFRDHLESMGREVLDGKGFFDAVQFAGIGIAASRLGRMVDQQ